MAHMKNPLATADQLYRRSSFGALPTDLQDTIFFTAQCLTQAAGVLLRIPQSVAAQANVVLARYWMVEPMLSHEFSDVSAATLFLVAKLSSHPCLPRDICNVYAYLTSPCSTFLRSPDSIPSPEDPSTYYLSETAYNNLYTRMLKLEARIMYVLSFDTHVSLPHPLAITYLQALDFVGQPKTRISQRVIECLNTALLSPQLLYLTHQPNALAVAAIYNAAKDVGAKLPDCSWWEVFDVDREELGFLTVGLRSLEGWVRKQKDNHAALWDGMVTKAGVEDAMRQRGLRFGNGSTAPPADEEDSMMQSLDERAETMDT